jgi:hypothetical protein
MSRRKFISGRQCNYLLAMNESLSCSYYNESGIRAPVICSAHAGLRAFSGASTSPGCFVTLAFFLRRSVPGL